MTRRRMNTKLQTICAITSRGLIGDAFREIMVSYIQEVERSKRGGATLEKLVELSREEVARQDADLAARMKEEQKREETDQIEE